MCVSSIIKEIVHKFEIDINDRHELIIACGILQFFNNVHACWKTVEKNRMLRAQKEMHPLRKHHPTFSYLPSPFQLDQSFCTHTSDCACFCSSNPASPYLRNFLFGQSCTCKHIRIMSRPFSWRTTKTKTAWQFVQLAIGPFKRQIRTSWNQNTPVHPCMI